MGIDIVVVELADTYLYQLKSGAVCTKKIRTQTGGRVKQPVCLKLVKGCLFEDGPFYFAELFIAERKQLILAFAEKIYAGYIAVSYRRTLEQFPTRKYSSNEA